MAFWSILGNIGKGLLGLGGGGNAGDIASKVADILGAGGQVASGAAAGRAAGRVDEAGVNQAQDRNALSGAQMLENALMNRGQLNYSQQGLLENAKQGRAGIDLQQREFALNAPSTRASQSVRGDIMANAQDATISHPRATIPNVTGGLRPSLMSANTRALGSEMSRKALMDQMAGDSFASMGELPTFQEMPAPTVPNLTSLPQAGGVDTFLNTASTAGSIWDIIQNSGLLDRGEKKTDPNAPTNAVPTTRQNQLFGNVRF